MNTARRFAGLRGAGLLSGDLMAIAIGGSALIAAVLAATPEPRAGGLGADTEPARIERLDPRFDALVPTGVRVVVASDGIEWAEGPLWDERRGVLLFSDVPRNTIWRLEPSGALGTFLAPSGYTGSAPFTGREPGSNGLAFDSRGRLLLCQHGDRSIARRHHDGRLEVLADRYRGKRLNSPNDLAIGPRGDLYFTDPPFGLAGTWNDPAKELPFQGVFRLRLGGAGAGAPGAGALDAIVTDLDAPNGIGFSPDRKTLYIRNAVHRRPIWMAYPVLGDGTVGAGRQFAEASAWVAPSEGVPDGLEVDRAGNLFAAGPGGVHVFAPDGARLGRIVTGVPTGNVAFGEDGATLFIAANHRILRLRTTTRGQ